MKKKTAPFSLAGSFAGWESDQNEPQVSLTHHSTGKHRKTLNQPGGGSMPKAGAEWLGEAEKTTHDSGFVAGVSN